MLHSSTILKRLADAIYRRPSVFVVPQLILAVACVLGTRWFLKADMDRNHLVGEDKRYHRIFLDFRKEFPLPDDVVAVIESDNQEKNRQFAERLGARLEAHSTLVHPTNLLTDVFYRGDLKMLGKKALLFVPENELASLRKALDDYRPFIEQFSLATNLATLFSQVNRQIRTASRENNSRNQALADSLPALERLIRRAEESLQHPGTPPSPGIDALFGAGPEAERNKYITFANGRLYLVTAKARDGRDDTKVVDLFRKLVAETRAEVPGVNVGVTGEPVLQYDEMTQSQKDSIFASLLSLALVALIFVFGYQQTGRPLKATACLALGLAFTMGYTTLVIGHLNILTITFVPMLIGMAIDFGVHLITRFEEEMRLGQPERTAMERAMVNTGTGILTGCGTTAAAFFGMALTDFKGIREMGIITGGGMLICLIPMLTLLPAWLLRKNEQNRIDAVDATETAGPSPLEAGENDHREKLERLWLDRPWTVLFVTLAISLLALWKIPKVTFDYNLLNMQSGRLPSVMFEKKLIGSSEKSVLFGAVVASSLEEAARLESELGRLPTVAGTDSMSRYLAGQPDSKLDLVRNIQREASAIRFSPADTRPLNLSDLSGPLYSLASFMSHIVDELANSQEQGLRTNATRLKESAVSLRVAMFKGDREANAAKLGAFQRALFEDIHTTFSTLASQDASPLKESDLPDALRHRFVGVTGKHLIQVYPRKNVWQRDAQEEFVREVRKVAPEVTGTPIQLYEYTGLLKSSYVEAAGWAVLAIVIMVFLHFRSIPAVAFSLTPVAIGALWMVGFMGWTGIPFNPANIMTLPLVIGIGVTNGIHILNRFGEEKNPSILAKSTGKAVLISGLTTVAGFGCLISAEHEGIRSLGWVMAVGTATCMVVGLTFLPALLNLRARRAE